MTENQLPPSQAIWPRKDWDRHREQVRRTNRARTAAIKQLIAENQERFDEVYEECCAAENPPVVPWSVRRRNRKPNLQQQVDELQAQLFELESKEEGENHG